MSSGSTSTAKSGIFSTSSWMRASNLTLPTIPTSRPKLRSAARSGVLVPLLRPALTAPREERGREVCRIAVTFGRAGLFLWRVGVRLHHLPIKMPGGMTEHRQNDTETDEERQRTDHQQCRNNQPPHGHGKWIFHYGPHRRPNCIYRSRMTVAHQRKDTTLMHRATTANRKPTPQPMIMSDHPSGVVNTRATKSGMLAAGALPKARAEGEAQAKPRARQNVILEMGMLLASLTRERVAILQKGFMEHPLTCRASYTLRSRTTSERPSQSLWGACRQSASRWTRQKSLKLLPNVASACNPGTLFSRAVRHVVNWQPQAHPAIFEGQDGLQFHEAIGIPLRRARHVLRN